MPAASSSARGQATVEFVLLVPLLVLLAGCLVGVTAVCLQLLALTDLARNCARTAAVSVDPVDTAGACVRDVDSAVDVQVTVEQGVVTVHLVRPVGPVLRLPGSVRAAVPLRATASMALEPPTPSGGGSVSVAP